MDVGRILVRAAVGGYRLGSYVMLAFIGAVLLIAPWWALSGIPVMAVLFAALGVWFDVGALDDLFAWTPARLRWVIVRLAILSHLVAGVWGVVAWARPIDPSWTLLAGSEEWNSPRIVFSSVDGFVVQAGGGNVWAHGDDGWRDLGGPPGGDAWEFCAAPDGTLWTAPRGTARLDQRDPATGRWRSLGRPPGELRSLAVGASELFAVVDGALHRLDMAKGTWSEEQFEGRVHTVALGGGTAVALGTAWWSREGEAGEWLSEPAPEAIVYFYGAVAGGWRYARHGNIWSTDLRVAPPGRLFEPRTPPVSDMRVMVPDPADGSRVIAGSWGEGIWASDDGGATWTALGLERVQAGGLAVDWRSGVVCVASHNTIWDRGVYCRRLPLGHPSAGSELMAPTGSP
ncbi:hypothetical protein [Nannocystis bainbridge]|uniref:Exo-alpha-sialidase n=1 Tax=Nannocystis bainbridge TaxID=2995303 RepID=A0ABT5DXW4_9BACT|nr:hypothetical protein [Nannocystis bainbridge]MDC0718452.1 hypothetical protein [Nannocystis bainbridge]